MKHMIHEDLLRQMFRFVKVLWFNGNLTWINFRSKSLFSSFLQEKETKFNAVDSLLLQIYGKYLTSSTSDSGERMIEESLSFSGTTQKIIEYLRFLHLF